MERRKGGRKEERRERRKEERNEGDFFQVKEARKNHKFLTENLNKISVIIVHSEISLKIFRFSKI